MGRERAIAALRGEADRRVACLEVAAHPEFIQKLTGMDPYARTAEAFAEYVARLDIDASILGYLEPPRTKDGATAQDERHVYAQWGLRDTAWLTNPLYRTTDEILAFDPRSHDGSSLQAKVDRYCGDYERAQRLFGDSTLYIPGHYQLVVHYMPFYCDWAVFLEALLLEPDRCRSLFDRCAEYSREVFEALAQTPAPAIVAHEDLCSARGSIYSLDLLRTEVFPRYAEIFSPVTKAGKRIFAFGEGKIEEIAEDLLAAGADGVFADQNNDLEAMIELVGPRGLLAGGIDTLTLTQGTPCEIREQVRQRMALAKRLPGFFFCVTGETPQNVSVENLEIYWDACREYGAYDAGIA